MADSLRLPKSMAIFIDEGARFDAVAGSLSLRSVSWQVGAIVGPVLVGWMQDNTTFLEAFLLAALTMVLAGWLFISLYSPKAATE